MKKELQDIVWKKYNISPMAFKLACKEWLLQKRQENQEKLMVGQRDGGTYFREKFIDELLEDII
jgi:hypothetical protein